MATSSKLAPPRMTAAGWGAQPAGKAQANLKSSENSN